MKLINGWFIDPIGLEPSTKSVSKVGIIIPALNEEKSIGLVIENLKKELRDIDYKIIVVDGRSKDSTVAIAKQMDADIIFQKNKGYGEALFAGYYYASKELNCNILVTLDADGTYSATDCVKIIRKIESYDADYVVGRRLVNSINMTTSHRFGNRVISWAIRKFLNIDLQDTQSGLFGFRSYFTDNINMGQSGWAVNTELLTKASELGMRVDQIDISYSERIGVTKGSTIKGGLINLLMIIRMIRDFKPLLFLGTMGSCLIALGMVFGGVVVYDWYVTGTIHHPNMTVLAALLTIAGVQVLSLSIVADMQRRNQRTRLILPHNFYTKSN